MTYWLFASPLVSAVLLALYLHIFQPWAKAYAETAAMLKARDERLDKILREVEAVTRTQEQIKADLSGDLWHRQTVWTQTKEIYANLLVAVQKMGFCVGTIPKLKALRDQQSVPAARNHIAELLDERIQIYNSSYSSLVENGALARIFVSDECSKLLDSFNLRNDSALIIFSEEWATFNQPHLDILKRGLIATAKRDLIPSR